ncbi:MAG: cupin domain-containing protein [Gammaproteobacteria bacterium]
MSTSSNDWRVFKVDELMSKVAGSEPRIHEFINQQSMSGIVYRLPAGSRDLQAPHAEDEIYVVLEGRARLKVGDEEHIIGPGYVLFVRATMAHSFFDIEEDLTVLAFFGAHGLR